MKIAGSYSFSASRDEVWTRIHNPATLIEIIPGCQYVDQISSTEYRGAIQLRLPAIVGQYTTYVKLIDYNEPNYCHFEGRVEGASGTITGTASFRLHETGERLTTLDYAGQGLITGPLAHLSDRYAAGLARTLIGQGLARLEKDLQEAPGPHYEVVGHRETKEKPMSQIVDLSVLVGEETLSPPSVNLQFKMTSFHRGPGFWQASKIEMLLHTGSHVDFSRHVQENGETAADVSLDRVFGEALVVDLSFAEANHAITVTDLEKHAPEIRPGDIVLVRTDWTEKHWGNFPTYYMASPYCTPEAAQWMVDRGAKAIGFDCFSEYCARLPDFSSEEFIIHKIILENGAILMQQLTNFSKLPTDRRFRFFAPFVKISGAEGSPARFFALLD